LPGRRQCGGKKTEHPLHHGDDIGMWNIGAYHRGMMAGRTPNLDKMGQGRHVVHRLLRGGKLYRRRANFITGQFAHPHRA